jgi:UDP-glucose 4-epimerase
LVTGGAGYIGSHTCLDLLRMGHEVQIVDNLDNGSIQALKRIKRLSNRDLAFTRCDIRDAKVLNSVFAEFQPNAVIHFAGLKAVGESASEPALYYDVNVGGTAVLLRAMELVGCDNIIFSSSATVYGEPKYLPCDENHPLDPINPYGRTKLIGENLLSDWSRVKPNRRHAVALRYFNPVGADPSGEIGEDPCDVPNNLMPFLAQVAVGRRDCLQIFGDDYDTIDGTGVRDYIHVTDLARSHVAAMEHINDIKQFEAINIGTGSGISVLQMIKEFEKQSGTRVKYEIVPRRPGDVAAVWADASKAKKRLGFQSRLGASEMCIDLWRWQSTSPNGYSEK